MLRVALVACKCKSGSSQQVQRHLAEPGREIMSLISQIFIALLLIGASYLLFQRYAVVPSSSRVTMSL